VSNEITTLAVSRLRRAMGDAAGDRCAEETLTELGLRELRSPSDLLDFANCLIKRGGVRQVVGSALRVSALLRGARDPDRVSADVQHDS
jgi:hypothetical protein